jgi:glucokinase
LVDEGLMRMDYIVGVDFGGTNLKAGLVNCLTGEVISIHSIPTFSQDSPDGVMGRMAGLVEEVLSGFEAGRSTIGGIGIGVPGKINMEKGSTEFLPNMPGNWPGVPLASHINHLTGYPVRLLNDVRAITFGEWKFGAGQGADSIACFAIGTGIGGGLVVNNQLVLGVDGSAGELGHITIDFNGPVCGCGNHGCVEAYASGPAITAAGIKAVTQGRTTAIGHLVDYDLNKITPELICQAALGGDQIAQEIYQQAGFYLGIAVANILVSTGPRRIVIGGGVAQAGELLLAPIRETICSRVKMMPVDQVEIMPAKLGTNAGIIGVAVWTRQQLMS